MVGNIMAELVRGNYLEQRGRKHIFLKTFHTTGNCKDVAMGSVGNTHHVLFLGSCTSNLTTTKNHD